MAKRVAFTPAESAEEDIMLCIVSIAVNTDIVNVSTHFNTLFISSQKPFRFTRCDIPLTTDIPKKVFKRGTSILFEICETAVPAPITIV